MPRFAQVELSVEHGNFRFQEGFEITSYVKKTSPDFGNWDAIFMLFRQDYTRGAWPNLFIRFVYTANGFVLEDNQYFAGNNNNMGGKDSLEDGEWHHVALTYSSNGKDTDAAFRLYIDGELTGSVEGTHKWYTYRSHCVVFGGRLVSNTDSFHGCFSNMRLSNAALTPDELLCADKGTKPTPQPETLAYWPLESSDGTSLAANNLVENKPSAYDFFQNGKQIGIAENDWQNDMDDSRSNLLYLGRYSSYTGCNHGIEGNFDLWRISKGALGQKELLNYYKRGMLLILK